MRWFVSTTSKGVSREATGMINAIDTARAWRHYGWEDTKVEVEADKGEDREEA